MAEKALNKGKSNGNIFIKGAKMHNLKNIDVEIPRNKFVVVTGLSGSGKSSLAFDTLYAEGQRRYVESLSSYARQFLGKLDKPEVDYIKGISPAIAIQQKVNTKNTRSTVGTTTEIYDYFKLLFARVGRTYSPISGEEVKKDSVTDVVNFISALDENTKVFIVAPSLFKGVTFEDKKRALVAQGFSRVYLRNKAVRLEKIEESDLKNPSEINILIDRIVIHKEDIEDSAARLADSVQTAFFEGNGACDIYYGTDTLELKQFNNKFERDGMEFETPTLHTFAFNNPVGACKRCEGFGTVVGIDPDLVIPNKNLSVYDDAIACWKGEKMAEYKRFFIQKAAQFDFPIHRPINELNQQELDLLWHGNKDIEGLHDFFRYLESKSYKIQYRVMLSRYRGKTLCPECKGTRVKKEAQYVKINGASVTDLVLMPIDELTVWFENLPNHLTVYENEVAKRILIEINNRLKYLQDVGLSYLTLNRTSATLSGGESQRIHLATMLGSSLVGSMYILDEPSIGLHPRDTDRLIGVLKALQQQGNTVIVVEHEEEMMRAADEIIDLGPEAGTLGGELIFQGDFSDIEKETKSLTAQYLTGKLKIETPTKRRQWKHSIDIKGARENNLQNVDVSFPLNSLTVVSGVSGSGKSSLVSKILYPALKKQFEGYHEQTGEFDKVDGDFDKISNVEFVDQNPIGKSSRSNPVTYIKAYDEIRSLFTKQPLAKVRGFKPAFFSFNVDGGRCDQCKGEGVVTVEMQFMADIHLTCDVCHGNRFKSDVLEITYQDKNIAQVLEMTIDDAIEFFKKDESKQAQKIVNKLLPLQEVGLGYVHLGQSSNTLSGGEAQRIKLAYFLSKGITHEKLLFIFDEPTTGLHFHDIKKLLKAFNALIAQGHSIIVVEHNSEVIKSADWVIDLGPEGGKNGGQIVFTGTPENLVKSKESYTGQFLKGKI